jgi:hypothetical protein
MMCHDYYIVPDSSSGGVLMLTRILCGVLLSCLLFNARANGGDLPEASIFQTQITPTSYTYTHNVGEFDVATSNGVAHYEVSELPNPALISSINSDGYLQSDSSIIYYFRIGFHDLSGPAPVLVDTMIGGDTGVYGDAYATAGVYSWQADGSGAGNQLFRVCSATTARFCAGYSGSAGETFSGTLYTGVTYALDIYTTLVGYSGISYANARIDPYIFIDPSVPDAASYSVDVSAGIGNFPSTVPEPPDLLMAVAGVALLAALRPRPKAC